MQPSSKGTDFCFISQLYHQQLHHNHAKQLTPLLKKYLRQDEEREREKIFDWGLESSLCTTCFKVLLLMLMCFDEWGRKKEKNTFNKKKSMIDDD